VPLLEEALDYLLRIKEAWGSAQHDNIQHTYARALLNVGRRAEAALAFEKVVELRRVRLGESHPLYAQALHNLASAHAGLGNLELAQSYLKKALSINSQSKDRDYAATLNTLATVHAELGNNQRAEELVTEAARIHRINGDIYSYHVAQFNLSELKFRGERFTEARELLESILAERSGVDIASELDIMAHAGLAHALIQVGRYQESHTHAVSAWDAAPRIIGSTNQRLISIAEVMIAASLAIGDDSDAERALRGWLSQLDELYRQVAVSTSARGRARGVRLIQRSVDTVLSFVSHSLLGTSGSADVVGCALLRFKGIAARLAALHRSSDLLPAEEIIDKIRRVAEQQHDLEMTGPPKDNVAYEKFAADQDRLQTERDDLELRLSRMVDANAITDIDVRDVANSLPLGCALVEFARSHRADLSIHGPSAQPRSGYVALVVSSRLPAKPAVVDLGSADAIDETIRAYHEALESATASRASLDLIRAAMTHSDADLLTHLGRTLRERIFDPLAPYLESCTHLLIAPDGEINSVPFEILPGMGDKYLIDSYVFSYLSSGSEILHQNPPLTRELGPSVVVAAPDYDLGASARIPEVTDEDTELQDALATQHFGPLAETEKEGRLVAELLGVQPWLGPDASKARVCRIQRPRFLHIATHGYYLPNIAYDEYEETGFRFAIAAEDLITGRFEGLRLNDPLLRSGLVLAGANAWLDFGMPPAEAGNGLLTADDVMRMQLSGTELVVLSACETGIGHVRNLEGTVGLRRAFAVAGARATIVSLWKVDDLQTRELFVDFYQRLLQGESSTTALRAAQLALRQRYPHPRHWGGFIHQGFERLTPRTT
jgi:CHAT domain-containing protein